MAKKTRLSDEVSLIPGREAAPQLSVDVYDGDEKRGTATATAAGEWRLDNMAFAVGPHRLVARVGDTVSNTWVFTVESEDYENFDGESNVDFASTESRDVGTFVLINGIEALGSGIRDFKGQNGYPDGPTAYLDTREAIHRVEVSFKRSYARIRCRITTPEARSYSADAIFIDSAGREVHHIPLNSQSRLQEIDYSVPQEERVSILAFSAKGTGLRSYFVTMDEFILTRRSSG
jgi:hypothetical protein